MHLELKHSCRYAAGILKKTKKNKNKKKTEWIIQVH